MMDNFFKCELGISKNISKYYPKWIHDWIAYLLMLAHLLKEEAYIYQVVIS
jgi:hypothetical protein